MIPPRCGDEYTRNARTDKEKNLYTVDAYDWVTVESVMLTKGLVEKCCTLAVADRTPWATLSVLIGRHVTIVTESHGDVRMNAPRRHVFTYHSDVAILEG